MPHQFTHADQKRLEGVWRTRNRRRFCAWRFETETGRLQTSRGVAVRSATLSPESRSLQDLKELLPQIALQMAREIRARH